MHIFDTHLIITHNGFRKGGRAAEGGPPPFVEVAEGRRHFGGGRHCCRSDSSIALARSASFPARPAPPP